jgi:hypothetical protein
VDILHNQRAKKPMLVSYDYYPMLLEERVKCVCPKLFDLCLKGPESFTADL